MASNRHLGRIIVLQTLYELIFREECKDSSVDIADIMKRNIGRYKATLDDVAFIEDLATGVAKNAIDLDAKIQPLAPEWPLGQIARIDHILLKMGVYELSVNNDVPPKVVINEAVELAKSFGGDNSSKFVNGVLGSFLRQQHPEKAAKLDKAAAKKTARKQSAKTKKEEI